MDDIRRLEASLFVKSRTSQESKLHRMCPFLISQATQTEGLDFSQCNSFPKSLSPISTWIQQRPEHAEYVCMHLALHARTIVSCIGGCRQAAELRGDGLPDLWIWLAGNWAGVPEKHVTCCESYWTCSTDVTAERGREVGGEVC